MKYELILTHSAEQDVILSYDWYESKKAGLGENFLYELEVLFKYIHWNPKVIPY